MPQDLSRREEQRGWRKIYLWGIPIALIFGVALVFLVPFVSRGPSDIGLDETVTKGLEQQTGTDALIQATVGTKVHDKRGDYLTDGFGRALYLFKKDQQGSGGTQAGSKCYEACAKFWPPLLTAEEPKAEASVKPNLLGTIGRKDGGKQVTYNGWPLYRYAKDVGPQKATGHDITEFGAEWYLVSPSGRELNETHTSDEG